MAVSLSGTRTKAVTTAALTTPLAIGTTVEYSSSHFIPFNTGSTTPPSFTVANTVTTNGSATLTTTGNGFAAVKVGDSVTGTGIPSSTTVSAVGSANSITMSANASASATITATFAPVAGTPTYFAIELVYSASGSVVALTPYLHVYDGTLPPGTAGSNSNSAKKIKLAAADGVTPLIFDQDNFLTNYRVPRS